jgi:hypothetical protein
MFAVNSRYYGLPVLAVTRADGTQVLHAARRLLPDPDTLTQIGTYVVGPADRLDRIAAAVFGDPQQAWRIADGTRVLDPDELPDTGPHAPDHPARGTGGGCRWLAACGSCC